MTTFVSSIRPTSGRLAILRAARDGRLRYDRFTAGGSAWIVQPAGRYRTVTAAVHQIWCWLHVPAREPNSYDRSVVVELSAEGEAVLAAAEAKP